MLHKAPVETLLPVLSDREAEAMVSVEQQVISNLKLFSRSIGFSVTREAIDSLT
jgi:hypothetical protein